MKSINNFKSFFKILIVASVLFYGCKGNEIYPVIPSITFKDAYVIFDQNNVDSLIVLIFSYKDGDGDLGLDPNQTNPPYNFDSLGPNKSLLNRFYNNVWIDYYGMENGEFIIATLPNAPNDTIRKDVRVTNLTPEGSHKAIRGDITVALLPIVYLSDTIKLKVKLVDRALNVSNGIETPIIYLNKR